MKKAACYILSALLGAIALGAAGFGYFSAYGGNRCDVPGKNCGCFCCNMFGLRGYESCGDFGLLAGLLAGALAGTMACRLVAWLKKIKINNLAKGK